MEPLYTPTTYISDGGFVMRWTRFFDFPGRLSMCSQYFTTKKLCKHADAQQKSTSSLRWQSNKPNCFGWVWLNLMQLRLDGCTLRILLIKFDRIRVFQHSRGTGDAFFDQISIIHQVFVHCERLQSVKRHRIHWIRKSDANFGNTTEIYCPKFVEYYYWKIEV